MRLFNKSKNILLAEKVKIANGFWMRTKGLIGEKKLESSFALVIPDCSSVHTFFMSIPIDILFLDDQNKIIKSVSKLAPYRFSFGPKQSNKVIELPAGTIKQTQTEVGDILQIQEEEN